MEWGRGIKNYIHAKSQFYGCKKDLVMAILGTKRESMYVLWVCSVFSSDYTVQTGKLKIRVWTISIKMVMSI